MTTASEAATGRPQDRVVTRELKRRRDWAKWGLSTYFVIFLVFLYAPMILMAVLSFQGYYGGVTFPFRGPARFRRPSAIPVPSRSRRAAASRRKFLEAGRTPRRDDPAGRCSSLHPAAFG